MTPSLPRTLVVSEAPISHTTGFGVTLSTFFEGWPSDRLRLLYTGARAVASDQRWLARFAEVPGHWGRRYGLECLVGVRPTWRGRYSGLWLRSALRGWKPEVVYAFVISGQTLAFAAWIAGRLGCPLVTHVADDGLESLRAGVTRSTASLLRSAASRISISEEMRVEYRERYGLDSAVLHNGAPEDLFAPQESTRVDHSAFIVRYLGSVVPTHHYDSIEDVCAAVRQMAAGGFPVRFEICGGSWTAQYVAPLADGVTVIHRGEVSREVGYELLRTADLLIVPVTFAPAHLKHVRFSLPTKLTEYLGSGTPTLVYGAAGTAPVEFCRRHHVGAVIDERSVQRLVAFMSAVAADRSAARRTAEADQNFIRHHYSGVAARRQLQSILRTAAASSVSSA